jgi:putative transposase
MAFQNYFRDLKKPVKQRHFQYPVFKKKFVAKDKFYLANDQFGVEEKRIRLPHLGWVRMQENLRFEGKILSATVAREADRWVVAVIVETEIEVPIRSENQTPVGIDLGIHQAAMLSTGKTFTAPMSLATNLQKLKRLQRQLARKKTGSKNRDKARMRLARQHRRVANARADFLHKLTTNLARRYDTIFLEDLDVVAMLKNHQLARALSDVGMGEFRRQIEYKTQLQGGQAVLVDRYFPSSKQCRKCGQKNEKMTLRDRLFCCPFCGHREDRDLNAARNILAEGQRILKTTGGTPGSQACGPTVSSKYSRFGSRRVEAGSGLAASKTPKISGAVVA